MRIILAVDGSEYSEAAARFVKAFSFADKAEVTLLHVLRDYLVPDAVDAARDFMKAGRLGARRLLDEYAAALAPARAETLVREGEPWVEILEAAGEAKADLVVMGHKGLGGVARFLMGGVSTNVLRHGDVSVLIVKGPPPAGRPMRILLSTNGSGQAARAAELVAGLPFPESAEALILSVVDMELVSLPERYYPAEDISRMMAAVREYSHGAAQKAVEEARARLSGRFSRVEEKIVFGEPEASILKEAEEFGADLVAMGSSALHGLKGALLGSVSTKVAKHAACSILVAKLPGR